MQVVIDIDDEYYSYLRRFVFTDRIFYRPVAIIAKGKPLPKCHGRLIDADAINRKDVNCANIPMNFIDTAPTIIEADGGDAE